MVLYSKVLIIKNKLYALHKMTFEIKSNTIQTCWYISHEIQEYQYIHDAILTVGWDETFELEIFAREARQIFLPSFFPNKSISCKVFYEWIYNSLSYKKRTEEIFELISNMKANPGALGSHIFKVLAPSSPLVTLSII